MIIIPMLIKVLLTTKKPWVCALLYGGCLLTNGLIFEVAFGGEWSEVLLKLAGATGLSFAFFWLLNEFEDSSLYWVSLVLGSGCLLYFF